MPSPCSTSSRATISSQAGLITLLNPKAIVFYMAFFPLFVDPAHHQGMLTFGVMASHHRSADLCLWPDRGAVDPPAGRAHARQSFHCRVLEKLAGVFLIGFGIKLAISK